MKSDATAVAVIGMAGRFPGAPNVDRFWRNLRDGVESIRFFDDGELVAAGVSAELLADSDYVRARGTIEDADCFDAAFFGVSPREAQLTDPQQRLFLESAHAALEDAGYDPGRYRGEIAVIAGAGDSVRQRPGQLEDPVAEYQRMIGGRADFLATRASYRLDLRGPGLTVQTACSTSLVAVCLAYQALVTEHCDMALAGGVSVGSRVGYVHREGMILSPDGHCRAFDDTAQGTVPGDGVGVVLLKRLDVARRDGDVIRAVIRGCGLNNDGAMKIGFTAPQTAGQAAVIARAHTVAGVRPEDVGYVEAHGTATPLGDAIELEGLIGAFGGGSHMPYCALGSVKTNIGHLDAAAGIAGLIKTVLAIEHQQIPPSLHYRTAGRSVDLSRSPFFVNTELSPWPIERPCAGVSSFGVGGTNAHVLLDVAPAREPRPTPGGPCHELLPVSAATAQALTQRCCDLADSLACTDPGELGDVAFTLQQGRRHMAYRHSVVAADLQDARRLLRDTGADVVGARGREVAFMFPGQGVRYIATATALHEHEPRFRALIERCLASARADGGPDVSALLFGGSGCAAGWMRTDLCQPALFILQYALAQFLIECGVRPAAVMGHSLGEFTAACIAGVMSMPDALRLVIVRGALMQTASAGAMVAVQLSEQTVRSLTDPQLALAAVNGDADCVVSGTTDAVAAFEQLLTQRGDAYRRLDTAFAFHSAAMDPVLVPFAAYVETIDLRAPRVPFASTLTGTWVSADELRQPSYWTTQLRRTVRCADALKTLQAEEYLLIEVGPGETLTGLARRRRGKLPVVASLGRPGDVPERARLLSAIGELWRNGATIDWDALQQVAGRPARRVRLPTYPFARTPIAPGTPRATEPAATVRTAADWLHRPTWQASPRTPSAPTATPSALIFGNGSVADALAARLGPATILVTVASGYRRLSENRFELDPTRREHHDELWSALTQAGRMPELIVTGWCLDRGASAPADPGHEQPFMALLALVQARGAHSDDGLRLVALTADAQSVFAAASNPEQATVLGLCRVIADEYPSISCINVDVVLPDEHDLDRWADDVVGELRAEPAEPVVALRAGGRLVLRHEPFRRHAPAAQQPVLRAGGVYLITGGLGGIGLVLAEHIGRHTKGKLVLTSRGASSFDDTRLSALRATGAEVLVRAADVCDLAQISAVTREARDRFGPINGVVHAAGLTSGGVLQRMDSRRAAEVLAPKVRGTLVLEAALDREQLDFLVLCSSLTALLGGFGQGDYCAANCFLDAYAQQQRATGRPVTSIDWDGWRDIGAAAREAQRQAEGAPGRGFAGTGDYAQYLTPAEGADIFARALATQTAQLIVSTIDLAERRGRQATHHASAESQDAPVAAQLPSPNGAAATADGREAALSGLWTQLLGTTPVDLDDDFFDLGGDSLLAVQVVHAMGAILGAKLPGHILIEHPTLRGLLRWHDAQSHGPDAEDHPRGHLVRFIEGTDTRQPLFFVHPAGGHVYFYRELARAIGPEQPFYGIQMPGSNGQAHALHRIEEIAARYIEAVRDAQPTGPYLLGGSSFGGLVAFEMAQQLQSLRVPVALVAMVDSPAPAAGVPELDEDAEILGYLLGKGASDEELEQMRRLTADERLAVFISRGGADERISSHASAGDVQQFLDMFRANVRSIRSYTPLPYAGRVLYAQAQDSDGVNALHGGEHWRHLVGGGFELVTLPGTHITVNLPPHVNALGDLLRTRCAQTPHPHTDRS